MITYGPACSKDQAQSTMCDLVFNDLETHWKESNHETVRGLVSYQMVNRTREDIDEDGPELVFRVDEDIWFCHPGLGHIHMLGAGIMSEGLKMHLI